MAAKPFSIRVEQAVLDDLQARLRRARWTSFTGESGWEAGTSPGYLRALVDHWRTRYDWRRHEEELNALPHFKAPVGRADLHFVHVQSGGTPLLLLHGWPDSFYRYHRVIPMLSDAFELVIPSLPGFAFTGPVPLGERQPTRQSAELLWHLMVDVLGHRRFAVAGGDGGSELAQIMAIDHPGSIIGVHLTDLGWHVAGVDPETLPKPERRYLEASRKRFLADGAYAMVHATRPRSLAPALEDSPVALASWIVDRFHAWCDSPDQLENSFSQDELLTNVMLYWITGTAGSSIFSYHADAGSPSLTPADRVTRPVGLALFPRDIGGIPPRSFAERTLNVQRWTPMPRGGHFAALEVPDLWARDVAAFFRSLVSVAEAKEARRGHPAL